MNEVKRHKVILKEQELVKWATAIKIFKKV